MPAGDTPYSTNKGLYFIRVGVTKQPPTQQELLRLFQKRNLLQLDETPVLRAGPDSINLAKVDMYLKEMGQSRLGIDNNDRLVNNLKNLSILIFIEKETYPTLGGFWLLAKSLNVIFLLILFAADHIMEMIFPQILYGKKT